MSKTFNFSSNDPTVHFCPHWLLASWSCIVVQLYDFFSPWRVTEAQMCSCIFSIWTSEFTLYNQIYCFKKWTVRVWHSSIWVLWQNLNIAAITIVFGMSNKWLKEQKKKKKTFSLKRLEHIEKQSKSQLIENSYIYSATLLKVFFF